MKRELIDIIEHLEANPHVDFWTSIKEYFGYDYIAAWKGDGSTDLREMLAKLNLTDIL